MDKVTKKRVKRYITWVGLAALVALLTAMPLLARSNAEADGPVASVLSAEVTEGSITYAIHGGGTVTAENVEEVKLPEGVKITEFLVKNGQYVTEGTALATVDKVSVMTAITQVNETLEYLRDALEDARDETVSSTVTAKAGGRVKKVFAQKGESVQDVMLRDGCLAILSLDGRMAVKIQRNLDVSTGENVTVTLENGEEAQGRVESNLDGTVVITVEDEGYEIGQTVSVTDGEGTRLGQGTLYIHNAWKAVAYTGTVETVYAKEEKTLSDGATLFTLTDRDFEGELNRRSEQHREYEQLLQELFQMYETGVLTAPCDGEVEGVDKDSPYLLSAVPEGWVVAPLTNAVSETGETGWTVMLLGSTSDNYPGCSNNGECTLAETDLSKHNINCIKHCTGESTCSANTHYSDCKSICTKTAGCQAQIHDPDCITLCKHGKAAEECTAQTHYNDCIWSCDHAKRDGSCDATGAHFTTCVKACTSSDGTRDCPATGDHLVSCIEACTHADVATACPAEGKHYTDCIKSCIESSGKENVCSAGKHNASCYFYGMTYTARAYKLFSVGTSELVVYGDAAGTVYDVQNTGTGWAILGSQLNTDTLITTTTISAANAASFKGREGSILLVITGTRGSESVTLDPVVYASGGGSGFDKDSMGSMMSGMGGMNISGMTGGLSGFGNYSGTTAAEDEGLFDLEGSTVLTVTPKNTATLTVSVDERDIAKLSTGMSATVTLEALKDEEFPAEVTAISRIGTNNGGSSKFAVELTLDMSEDMLSGMSAGAVIPLEEKQNVLLIPAAALVQQGAKTVVYTALDSDGNPTQPVEVTTGLTDGENVEVISGLTKGQKIYYSYYDTLELDTSAEASKYSFG